MASRTCVLLGYRAGPSNFKQGTNKLQAGNVGDRRMRKKNPLSVGQATKVGTSTARLQMFNTHRIRNEAFKRRMAWQDKSSEWRSKNRTESMVKQRDDFMQLFKDNLGPYSEKEMVDLYHSPAVPESEKPPRPMMSLYFRFARMRAKLEREQNGTKQVSFASRIKSLGRYRSETAMRLLDSELFALESSLGASHLSNSRGCVQAWSVAPIIHASVKAKFCFGRGAHVRSESMTMAAGKIPPPDPNRPEVAFIGCANRGQSSLINCVLNRIVCSFSERAGHTSGLHFVTCGSSAGNLVVVDCPGWVTHVEMGTQAEQQTNLTNQYLELRARQGGLKCVIFSIDLTAGIDYNDKLYLSLLAEYEISFFLCINRTDQGATRGRKYFAQLLTLLEQEMESYPTCRGIILTSVVEKKGITRLQNIVADYSRVPELGLATKSGTRMSDILPAVGYEKQVLSDDEFKNLTIAETKWRKYYREKTKADASVDDDDAAEHKPLRFGHKN